MQRVRRGFTLVEIMIVVVIIGLLAAMAIPAFQKVQDNSRISRFVSDLRTFAGGLETLMLEQGTLPGDPSTGSLSGGHTLLAEYINAATYAQETSLGGRWDIDSSDMGVNCVVGVDFGGAPTAQQLAMLQAVDELVDDGDLTTGVFQGYDGNRRGYFTIEL
jgi:prepilin-type N-terminal cleavage/methylation domain-containing protein